MFTTFALSQDIVGHTNHSPPTRVHVKRLKQIVSPSSSNKMFSGFRSLQHTKRERAEISVCKISKHERTIQDEEQQTEHTDFFFFIYTFSSAVCCLFHSSESIHSKPKETGKDPVQHQPQQSRINFQKPSHSAAVSLFQPQQNTNVTGEKQAPSL